MRLDTNTLILAALLVRFLQQQQGSARLVCHGFSGGSPKRPTKRLAAQQQATRGLPPGLSSSSSSWSSSWSSSCWGLLIRSTTEMKMSLPQEDEQDFDSSGGRVNGNIPSSSSSASSSSSSSSSSSALINSANSLQSQLANAFMSLQEVDQYDAVLTGLCAKILDDDDEGNDNSDKSKPSLDDPVSLLREMNQRRIQASPRSLMSLVDAAVKTERASSIANIMSLSLKNGGLRKFGNFQAEIRPLPPPNSRQRVVCPDGSRKTRSERLAALPPVPFDDRGAELTSALAFGGLVAISGFADVFGLEDISPYTNTILSIVLLVGTLDNFYDVIQLGLGFLNNDENEKRKQDGTTNKKNDNGVLPNKDQMPFGLGTGQLTGTVLRGLTRLLSVDTERECQCEAASFFAAYALGLPCFAFRPNALEAAVLVMESAQKKDGNRGNSLDSLLSASGMMKTLVWLMAPVAMEGSKHAQLIVSDPREAAGLLTRLEERAPQQLLVSETTNNNNINLDDVTSLLWWTDDEVERQDLMTWAYAEADSLLRNNRDIIRDLTERLAGGAATMGDCVAVVENW